MRTLPAKLARFHDTLTQWSYVVAGLASVGFSSLFILEVGMRYFLNAPTIWSQDAISIFLCISIFFALPEVTRRSEHVEITIVVERFAENTRVLLRKCTLLFSALILSVVAWMAMKESWRQFSLGIQTESSIAILKWPITAMISYGLASSSIYMAKLGIK